ncbi:SulP family inorganic anion transporter [Mycetocola manganoxydans]|uniref:SulP family inorganic anion transporter n=2 Tax=Mycetocola manganoxydans TaxID=699879 RepID=A0A3L6ZWN0_9MICO|nr:SulP family inorganic anion transporter [Mycetocola manganoxydans]
MARSPLRDLLAGATVAIVALPLALAFGVASGLGAGAGLTTAILAGIIAAIFGGSNLQISGPTGAMTVVLVPVVHNFGVGGVLQVGLMAGVLLIILAVSGVGKFVRYLPASLIEGFTVGIAVVIALQQVPNMLGVAPGDQEQVLPLAADAVARFLEDPNWIPPVITVVVAAMILIVARLKPSLPVSLIAVIAVTATAVGAGFALPSIGELPAPIGSPSAAFLDWGNAASLLPSAIAVAALGALESLLCATVADGMRVGEEHDPDRELLGQGLANMVVPFFGGVPATAAIARTAVNARAGAASRLSAISHSAILLIVVLAISPLVGLIPLAALAGVLLATTIQMVQVGAVRALLASTRSDAVVLVLTFLVTVLVDLVTAVVVGLAAAAILALRAVAQSAQLEQVPLDTTDHFDEERALADENIVAYRFDGPLFFGAAHRFLLELADVSDVSVVILRMSRVTTLDATGGLMLDDAIARLERRGIVVLVSGVRPGHGEILRRLGTAPHLRERGRIFEDTPDAIAHARGIVASP